MKRVIIVVIISLLLILAGCSSNSESKKIQDSYNNSNDSLIDTNEKLKEIKKELVQLGFTGEKLKQELQQQKQNYEVIANLTWEAKKKYIFENKILPQIIKDPKLAPKNVKYCHTTDLLTYAECINLQKIPLNEVLKKIPVEYHNLVKKSYYYSKYSITRKNLLQPTTDPIAIEMKKKKIQEMIYNHIITKPSVCNKLPEKEVQNYCKSLFNQK